MKGGNRDNVILATIVFVLACTIGYFVFTYLPTKEIPSYIENKPEKNQTQNQVIKVGDLFMVGSMRYQILSVTDEGQKYANYSTGGKFVVLTLEASNLGKEKAILNKIYIKDSKGRKYDQDTTLVNREEKLTLYDRLGKQNSIAPSFKDSFYVPFMVANDSTKLQLIFPNSSGAEEVMVNLSI